VDIDNFRVVLDMETSFNIMMNLNEAMNNDIYVIAFNMENCKKLFVNYVFVVNNMTTMSLVSIWKQYL
jgi:hypothetical protein